MKHYSVGHLCVGTLVAPKEKQVEKKSYCLLNCALTWSKRQTLLCSDKVELCYLVSAGVPSRLQSVASILALEVTLVKFKVTLHTASIVLAGS